MTGMNGQSGSSMGLPRPKSGRLPSLFGPKDLTLGSGSPKPGASPILSAKPSPLPSPAPVAATAGASRRQFVPNLAAAGKRLTTAAPQLEKEERGGKRKHREPKDQSRNNNNAKRRAFPGKEFVVSQGVFSNGPLVEGSSNSGIKDNSIRSGCISSSGSGLNKSFKSEERVLSTERRLTHLGTGETDDQALKRLLQESFIVDDDNNDSDFDDEKDVLMPVRLPLDAFKKRAKTAPVSTKTPLDRLKVESDDEEDSNQAPPVQIKAETGMKSEPTDLNDVHNGAATIMQKMSTSSIEEAEYSLPPLVLAQMPTVIYDLCLQPNLRASVSNAENGSVKREIKTEIGDNMPSTSASTSATAQSTSEGGGLSSTSKEPPHCLSSLPPGKIGKLQILRSGRVRMLIGDQRFNVEVGIEPSFVQEAVNVSLDPGLTGGDMYSLGRVKQKIVVTPDMEELMKQLANSSVR